MKFCQSVFLVACAVRAAQIPLTQSSTSHFQHSSLDLAGWDLDIPPSVDSTGHLIFDSVASLLQHWPNTRYRNGHNFVPGIVPPGTLLYHGRPNNEVPSIPEWVATDPEHSIIFCREECWHLTLVTTRPLKVLYFDGSSAAKMKNGSMDSQDILLWGETKPDMVFAERQRIAELCEWGKKFRVDGYVRMEMDFEIMLCDFTSGVETLSLLNLADPHDLPSAQLRYEVISAGSWHNSYPGETRIVLDLSRLVSGYDTSLFPSLVEKRRGQERWQHRLEGMSSADVVVLRKRLADVLNEDTYPSVTRVDWSTLAKTIFNRYYERLPLTQYIINNASNPNSPDNIERIHRQLRVMLAPYTLSNAVPQHDGNFSWASPVYKECSISHTAYLSRLRTNFTPSERTLLAAIEGTSREICRVITKMWAEGVLAGAGTRQDSAANSHDTQSLAEGWRVALGELMQWLDWSVWVQCNPACSFEELCYLPTWPYFGRPRFPRPGPPHRGLDNTYGDADSVSLEDDWVIPKPRCVRRLDPYTQL